MAIQKDSGKAKAKLAALGFQYPDLGAIHTAAPTTSKRASGMWLQFTSNANGKMNNADAKSAVLPSNHLQGEMATTPVPEFRKNNRFKQKDILLLTKAAYGLSDALRELLPCIHGEFLAMGWEALVFEPST